MAKVGSLYVDIGANIARLQRDLGKSRQEVRRFSRDTGRNFQEAKRSTDKFNRSLTGMKRSLTGIAAVAIGGIGISKLAGSFLDAAKTSENYRIRLNALLGSVEKGNKLFDAMSDYASKVPFEYNEIMSAATQLSGVMKGGVQEISQWMPMIGDLAAVSGLGIEKTTEQVVRMYSAGAGAADLFRERGITAMMGFEAGVSYSAEETRKKMFQAWQKADSQFKGVTAKLADTWDGLMSMLKDKWFALRNKIMDAGVYEALKKALVDINEQLAKWIENNAALIAQKIPEYVENVTRALKNMKGPLLFAIEHWKMLTGAVIGFKLGGPLGALFGAGAGGWLEVWDSASDAMEQYNKKAVKETEQRIKNLEKQQGLVKARAMDEEHAARMLGTINEKLIQERNLLETLKESQNSLNEAKKKGDELGGTAGGVTEVAAPPPTPTETKDAEKAAVPWEALAWEAEEEAIIEAMQKAVELEKEKQEELAAIKDEAMQEDMDRYQSVMEANARFMKEQERIEKMKAQAAKEASMDMLGDWAYAFAELGKKQKWAFEVSKAFSIAQTAINTYEAAMASYKALAGIPIIGPALGAAAAAAAVAAGMARVNQIRSTEPGTGVSMGGVGGQAMPTYEANPVTGTPEETENRPQTTIIIEGDFYGEETFIDRLAEKISMAVEDRDVRLVASDARYAEALS